MSDFATVDPASGKTLEQFSYFADAEIDERLDAAAGQFRTWRNEPSGARTRVLNAVAKTLRERSNDLALTAVREMGKPVAQARAEIEKCAWACEFFAQNAESFLKDQAAESNASESYVSFRPLGVIFAIMPWNFPYWQVFRAAAPAIAAGNTIVLKHADSTTRCALNMQEIFAAAGAPEGLFGTLLVNHDRADSMIGDERIAAVTLTGSERAGIAVGQAAGKALKKCVLELGGSDPFVVLADAHLDRAVEVAVKARFQNNGQSCIAAKRFIVEDSIYDRFVRRFAEAASQQRVGDPSEPETEIGPCARKDLRDELQRQITQSVVDGGRIISGGKAIDRDGFFYEPTVVADIAPGAAMFEEETFGPAAAVVRASDDREALDLANRSKYGLGANIWTESLDAARAFAAKLETGMVAINGMVASDPRLPFGGVKRSGYGRELSAFGIREFVNIQSVWIGPERTAGAPAE